jgi:hypothetical protein
MTGYSDRINHAFAFAAKHLDQQVRKGTRLPYLTAPSNVAIILTRYGREEHVVVAGILRDVVEDCMRDGFTGEVLSQRIAEKFGDHVLATALAATPRRADDEGVELAGDERRDDFIERLANASDDARWVVAADLVHASCSLLSDLERTEFPDSVWTRLATGREGTIRWYRRVHDRLAALGFGAPIMDEVREAVERLERMPVEEPR